MKNECGVDLDKNGYAPSIVYEDGYCFFCLMDESAFGSNLVRHEAFGGPNRQKSKRLGLWVNLCPHCHEEIHKDARKSNFLRQIVQADAMHHYGWSKEDFIREIGKNYLEE